MNDVTIRRLNQINREFYRVTARDFDETRGRAWPGWEAILPHVKPPLSVLDVGCGNGRFGVFLAEKLGTGIRYHGIDSSPALLDFARQALQGAPGITPTLEQRDIVESPLESGTYDLVALFGVLHHVPGFANRQEFMRNLALRVAPDGLFVFACWRFYEYERFRERIIPWPDDIQVEKHDYLLDWRRGENAQRYCHHVDDAEHADLIQATGLAEIQTYRADGFTGTVNRYSILRPHSST